MYLPFTDWIRATSGQCPFAVPNQSVNGKYNLISVWFNKIPKSFLNVCTKDWRLEKQRALYMLWTCIQLSAMQPAMSSIIVSRALHCVYHCMFSQTWLNPLKFLRTLLIAYTNAFIADCIMISWYLYFEVNWWPGACLLCSLEAFGCGTYTHMV